MTERADVVLPVAPVAEKSGVFLDWEGRSRSFEVALRNTGAMADGRVLDSLAAELGVPLELPDAETARAEIDRLGARSGAPPAPAALDAPAAASPRKGEAVLAT